MSFQVVIDSLMQKSFGRLMSNQPRIRPFSLWELLTLNPGILWQAGISLTFSMLALSLAITGAPWGGLALALASAALAGWAAHNGVYLVQHDLPLLRHGIVVAARVAGKVTTDQQDQLYRINYRLPGDEGDRVGVFLAANDSAYAPGEPVAIMIDPDDPARLLEISGRYEPLFITPKPRRSGTH